MFIGKMKSIESEIKNDPSIVAKTKKIDKDLKDLYSMVDAYIEKYGE